MDLYSITIGSLLEAFLIKAQWILPACVILIALALQAGCASAVPQAAEAPTGAAASLVPTPQAAFPGEPDHPQPTATFPTQTIPEKTTMHPSQEPTPASAWLQNLVEKAQADLALRLSISVTEITMVSAEGVTWPDSSLGCPQAGMAYAQMLTAGYRIILVYAGRKYEYHAGKGTEAFYCPNPTPPVPGAPGNT